MPPVADFSQTHGSAGACAAPSAAEQNAIAYLDRLRSLLAETSLAMEAIASNRPLDLLESTRRQETLSLELVAFGESLVQAGQHAEFAISPTRVAEMRQAERLLRDALGSYSALVQRSAKSVALLARLHSSYTAEYPGADQSKHTPRTWSCEG